MTRDLTGRTSVVIGGTSGMGRAVVDALLAAGSTVVTTSRDPEGSSAAADLKAAGVRLVRADVTTPDGLDELVEAVPTVDHLVLSAAGLTYRPFRDFPASDAAGTVDGKLLGYWNAVHRLAPALSEHASVVLFSGVASVRPGPGTAAVTAANAGVEGLGRSLAVELAPVRVNVLNPGVFETASWAHMEEKEREEFYAETASSLPVGRIGQPEDAADAVLFLLTNPQVTGTVLDLDGGARLV
ncbi:SDR family oxidoreductase [Streptomyces sp. NP160]|uniref:SDR family oxidoreductase n=1 Tax=Streptomyces sp. NP160 TaxID=2586637 RepID=UPI0015D5E931|nr:SDR family oxidoreductase [Streptomyces sp. NP160]